MYTAYQSRNNFANYVPSIINFIIYDKLLPYGIEPPVFILVWLHFFVIKILEAQHVGFCHWDGVEWSGADAAAVHTSKQAAKYKEPSKYSCF